MLNITGETMLFRNENGYYSTTISNKKMDGSYENMYINVQMPKGTDLPNQTKINIIRGFLSFYVNNANSKTIKFVVLDYDIADINDMTMGNDIGVFTPSGKDDDLPF